MASTGMHYTPPGPLDKPLRITAKNFYTILALEHSTFPHSHTPPASVSRAPSTPRMVTLQLLCHGLRRIKTQLLLPISTGSMVPEDMHAEARLRP